MYYDKRVNFSELLDKTIEKIHGEEKSDELTFNTADGETYKMYHEQDCCESVSIEEIIGDLKDLIGKPILLAEEVADAPDPRSSSVEEDSWRKSETWTFYKLSTIKGSVTIRWLGSSNGYYSERVDFIRL